MQVILPSEQIHQIQLLISDLIKQEIENRLNNSNLESPFLNKQQTCDYLGISNNTLDSWIQKGLPTIRIGKTVRFDKNEINRWMQKQ
ncbi:helix-turn-helix transcriptional regulator [Streptococcus anginosus]|uniref:helix-turn-helix transcriptional regulator n=1 Tax=Streptococcus anginosus TaxID=1328 RepID=UPI0019572A31|nr:helix-turn-helix domain-containing protein [Streptococcus anginosus]VTY18157.1 Helix-turn-helix domain protein [Streptococcus anginosus]